MTQLRQYTPGQFLLFLLGTFLILGPCPAAAAQPERPERVVSTKPEFRIPEDSLAGRFHRIAFGPTMAWHAASAARDSVKAVIESLLVERLRSFGFEVIEPRVGVMLFRELADSLGGVIGQKRGSYDPERAAVAHIQTILALHRKYRADALVYWVIQEWGEEAHDFLTVRIEDSEGHTVYEHMVDVGSRAPLTAIVRDRPKCAAAVKAVLSPFYKATLRR